MIYCDPCSSVSRCGVHVLHNLIDAIQTEFSVTLSEINHMPRFLLHVLLRNQSVLLHQSPSPTTAYSPSVLPFPPLVPPSLSLSVVALLFIRVEPHLSKQESGCVEIIYIFALHVLFRFVSSYHVFFGVTLPVGIL